VTASNRGGARGGMPCSSSLSVCLKLARPQGVVDPRLQIHAHVLHVMITPAIIFVFSIQEIQDMHSCPAAWHAQSHTRVHTHTHTHTQHALLHTHSTAVGPGKA
jgi:hypothetical protein